MCIYKIYENKHILSYKSLQKNNLEQLFANHFRTSNPYSSQK